MDSFPAKHRPAKSWQKISVQVDPLMTEAVAAYLTDLTGSGLEIEAPEIGLQDSASSLSPEQITAYLPVAPEEGSERTAAEKIEELKLFLSNICHVFPASPAPILKTEIIQEEDWGRKWKSFFTAFQITKSLTIKPSWENDAEPQSTKGSRKFVLEMDPGLAFGTGHHASTQLALQLLDELILQQRVWAGTILDVGTGSGILAMACVLFGAKKALAIDNDPDAVETARQNIVKNRLANSITVSSEKLPSLKGSFDLIVANITHDILTELSTELARLLKPKGFLVLSGILKGSQEESIRNVYEEEGLHYLKSLAKEEWAALLLEK